MNEIVRMIRLKVMKADTGSTVPAICLSGGIDSTVILHHVVRDTPLGMNGNVHTFTATFGNEKDEREKARLVSNFYKTHHTEILITKQEIIDRLPRILRHFPFPRYNVWPWLLVEKIARNHTHLFTAEGSDELFGYPDRSFLEGWAGQLVWVHPSWKTACDFNNMVLHTPFLDIQDTQFPVTGYYNPPNKEILRKSYQGILPDFVTEQPSTPPSLGFYKMMGMGGEDLQIMAAKAWLETRSEVHTGTIKRL